MADSHPKCEDPYFSLRRGSYGSIDRANQQRPSNSTSKAGKPALRELPPPLPHSSVAIYMHSLQAQ